MKSESAQPSTGISYALVSYIPNPLGSFLEGLRRQLTPVSSPQPHITLLPPRHLEVPVEQISERIREVLGPFTSFSVELCAVHAFAETNFLYLDICNGSKELNDLHDALNQGDLNDAEQFPFRPHLTLAGPVSPQDFGIVRERAEAEWKSSPHPCIFQLEQVVLLCLPPGDGNREWVRVHTYKLGRKAARAAVAC
jgi:2'-5' RNA ligase